MCLECILLCPRCGQPIEDVDTLYPCLLKLRSAFSPCTSWRTSRFITPIELFSTAKFCTNQECAMSLAQQLIRQSEIWHAVDILDMKLTEESEELKAGAPTIPQRSRASIRKFERGGSTLSAPIPPVAEDLNYPDYLLPRVPDAGTPANLLLHQALSERQQLMDKVRVNRGDGAMHRPASFWDQKIDEALEFREDTYDPSRTLRYILGSYDNSQQAAKRPQYAVLCCPGDITNIHNFSWYEAVYGDRSATPRIPALRAKAAPGPNPGGSSSAPAFGPSSEPPLPQEPQPPEQQSLWPVYSHGATAGPLGQPLLPPSAVFPAYGATANPSSTTGTGFPNQDSFDHGSPSKYWGMPLQTGQMPGTQPALEPEPLFLNDDSIQFQDDHF